MKRAFTLTFVAVLLLLGWSRDVAAVAVVLTGAAKVQLLRALEDRDAFMRVSAIQALEVVEAKEVAPPLQRLLDDQALPSAGPRVPVGDTAKAAVRKLTRQP